MKRFALWLTLSIFALTLAGCSAQSPSIADAPPIENPYLDCSYKNIGGSMEKKPVTPDFNTLDELTTDIVRGYLLDDRRQDLQYIGDTKIVVYGCNISALRITHVYKGNLKAGDEVPFAENYYYDEADSTVIYTYENYQPSVPGQEYIFFMSAAKEGMFAGVYTPNDYNLGRYPFVSARERTSMDATKLNNTYNIGISEEQEMYEKFFEGAIKKYGR